MYRHDIGVSPAGSARYSDQLCHMNSGNTFPIPVRRGRDSFRSIFAYPARGNGSPAKEVVELTVESHLLDVAQHVVQAHRMRGAAVLGSLPLT
jgi:hypothetical protein